MILPLHRLQARQSQLYFIFNHYSNNYNTAKVSFLQEVRSKVGLHIPNGKKKKYSHQRVLDVLIAYGQFVELYIYQGSLAIGPGPSQFSPSVSEPFDDDTPLPGYGRLEILWKSMESLKRWLEAFYRMSPSTCIGLPFHFWSQLVRCTVILKYLSTLDDPAWDCRAVQKDISIVSALETISQKLDETSREASPESDDDAYRLLSKLMGRSRE